VKLSNNQSFVASWSGGKDSCFAFMEAVRLNGQPKVLMNMMNENGLVSRSHAIPKEVLQQQAVELGLPIVTVPSTWNDYEINFINTLRQLVEEYEINSAVFGDIDFDSNRAWEEKVCEAAFISPVLPLWKQDRKDLVMKMLIEGIHCIIVSCNQQLGEDFLGKKLDEELIKKLEELDADVCGENGEYHTLVVNCPLYRNELNVEFLTKRNHNNYWFQEMKLKP
jgi:diphthine-ammonia ligase